MSNSMTQNQPLQDQPGKVRPRIELRKIPEKIFWFLLELIAPALIAAVAIYYLSGAITLPFAYQRQLPWIYGGLLVLISLLIAVVWSVIPGLILKRPAQPGRLIIMGVSGLAIPLAVLLASAWFSMPDGQSYLAYYLPSNLVQNEKITIPSISSAILNSSDTHTKVLGITALGSIHQQANLDQLIQLVSQSSSNLNNPLIYQALSTSIAAYGLEAKLPLINLYNRWSQAIVLSPKVAPPTLYNLYFSGSIQALQSSIDHQDLSPADKATALQQLAVIKNNLQADLDHLQIQATSETASDIRLDFILDTFYRMPVQQDADILALAKATAANPVYPAVDRHKAILLIGKLGTQADMGLVSSYLQNSSDEIKAGALEALVMLDQKSVVSPQSATPTPAG